MSTFTLQSSEAALLIIDMQEKLFPAVDRGLDILNTLCKVIKGFQILSLPIIVSEQYPQGLGSTIEPLQKSLGSFYNPWVKSTFSCMDDPKLSDFVLSSHRRQWIVAGIEAHICVLQTVKGLLSAGKEVVVLNDAITSRSIYDFSTSIAEMRDAGARISCAETVLFELLKDSKHPQFKAISNLIKASCPCC